MSMSLREQLLAAGLVNKKQAKQANRQHNQQQHQQTKHKTAAPAEPSLAAQYAQAAAARAQELNRKQQEKAERKARLAQIKQLIEQNRLPKVEGDDYYNFVHGKKIRRIAVDAALRERLTRGEVAIVRCEGRSDVVPADIAARIRERDEHTVIEYKIALETPAPDDPYKDFVVPDDLMW